MWFCLFLDHENDVRTESPSTQPLKSSFRPIHDRWEYNSEMRKKGLQSLLLYLFIFSIFSTFPYHSI